MRPIAKREIDATKLALQLSGKTTEELHQILLRRHPGDTRRFAYDRKTRNAAARVLRVRQRGSEGAET